MPLTMTASVDCVLACTGLSPLSCLKTSNALYTKLAPEWTLMRPW